MIQVLDKDGIIRYISPRNPALIGTDMSHQPYYHETITIQKAIPVELPYWSPTFISEKTNEPTLSISKVMKTGMVVGYLNLDILNTITSRLKPEKGHAIIVDRDGTVISHHNYHYVTKRVNLKDLESVRTGLAGIEGTVRETIEDKETLSSVTIVPQNGWLVIFQQDADKAFATVYNVKLIFIIGIAVTLGIAIIMAILSIQRTLTPLAQLITNIKSVASGEYSSNPVEKSYQEIDELSENFDTMMWEVKSREEALIGSEEKYRMLVEKMTDGLTILDADGIHIFVNDRFCDMLGYLPSEIIGRKTTDFVDPFNRVILEKQLEERREGRLDPYELTYIRKDGSELPALVSPSAIFDNEGNFTGSFGVITEITDLKKTENELRKSEAKYQNLVETIPHGIQENDLSGVITFSNAAHHRMLGYDAGELVGKTIWDLLASEPEKESLRNYLKVLIETRPSPTPYVTRSITKDGRIIDTTIDWDYKYDENGDLIGFISVITDITKQKNAQDALMESEEKFRSITEASPMGMHMYELKEDGQLIFIGANPAADMILGVDNGQFIGKTIEESFPPLIDTEVPEKYRSVAATGEHWNTERIDYEDDQIRGAFQVHAFQSSPGKMVALFLDITERKIAEEALKESEERFRGLTELLPESIFEIDTNNIVTYANRNAFRQFGYTDKDFQDGINGINLLAPKDRERAQDNIRKIMSGEDIGINEYTAEHKDGTRFPVMFRSTAVIRHGNPVGLRGFIIDMTEQKRLEGQLRQTQKMEAIGTLAGGIAHDFNNILTAIIGYSEVLKRKLPDDSPGISALDNILDAGERASDLVKQILAFSRRDEAEYAPTLIEPIAKEVLKLIRSTFPATIELLQQINPVGPVIADPTQIHQIIMNLWTNTYHAMQVTGGKMQVDLEEVTLDGDQSTQYPDLEPGRYAQLTVKDTGHGIDPSIIDRIFDPYFTTKEKGKGTGLGLSVVHGIVKNFGGTVQVHSELSRGTDVHVLLPVTEIDTSIVEPTDTELPRGDETVLFVDNEESLTILCRELLEILGYEVTTITRAVEALELFKSDPDRYDMVITDMTMPVMTGLKLSEELLAIRPDIPIILCTGYSEDLTEESVKQKGIKAFLMKPFSSGNLSRLIRTVLDGNKA